MDQILNIDSVSLEKKLAMARRVDTMLERELNETIWDDRGLFMLTLHVCVYDMLLRNIDSAVLAGMYDGAIQELEKMNPSNRN